jgi:hypothetical protein
MHRPSRLLRLGVLSAIAIAGCSSENQCARPLSGYFCVKDGDCPSFEEALAEGFRDLETGEVEVRPCEDTRFIVWLRNIDGGGSVLYFDESNTIVAAESFGYDNEQCGGQVLFGPVPECPDEQRWRGVYCISCREPMGAPGPH